MTVVTAVVNLTQHPIQVMTGDTVLARWEPSGQQALRAEFVRDAEQLTVCGTPVPRVVIVYGDHLEGLPPPVPGTAYIVSRVAAAQTRRADVYFPFGEVRDGEGRIIGCRSLGQFVVDSEGEGDA